MYIQCDPYTASSQFGEINALLVKSHTPNSASAPAAPVTSAVTTTQSNIATANQFATNDASATTLDGVKVLSAYPNPFIQDFTLSVPASNNDKALVTVSDAGGKTVFAKQYEGLTQGANYLRISLGGTPSGFYFVTVTNLTTGDRKTLKVIKD
jgi:hypothetical protein